MTSSTPDDFEPMMAALRELIDSSADSLYRRLVKEMRDYVAMLCVLREKLKNGA